MSFYTDRESGRHAEEYIEKNVERVTGAHPWLLRDMKTLADKSGLVEYERVEGMDACGIECTGKSDHTELRQVGPDRWAQGYDLEMRSLSIETKAVERNAAFLIRDDNGNEPSGTLPFEVWQGRNNTNGWLHAFVDPLFHDDNREMKTSHCVPDYLVFALILDDKGKRIMATISFQWAELEPRLNELSGKRLIPWKLDYKDGMREELEKSGMKMLGYGKVWHVPLSELVDLARIVMVEEPTEEELQRYEKMKRGRLKPGVIRDRLAFLKEHAEE